MDLFVYYSPLHSGSDFGNKVMKITIPTPVMTSLLVLGKSRVNEVMSIIFEFVTPSEPL